MPGEKYSIDADTAVMATAVITGLISMKVEKAKLIIKAKIKLMAKLAIERCRFIVLVFWGLGLVFGWCPAFAFSVLLGESHVFSIVIVL